MPWYFAQAIFDLPYEVSIAVWAVGINMIPVGIGMAVLRYRLFEIDRLVSRAVAYALVVVFLGGVYLFGAVWLPTVLFDFTSPLFVAGSTLAVAVLMNPLRKRALVWTERRFHRSHYDSVRTVDRFVRGLRDETDVQVISSTLLDVTATRCHRRRWDCGCGKRRSLSGSRMNGTVHDAASFAIA